MEIWRRGWECGEEFDDTESLTYYLGQQMYNVCSVIRELSHPNASIRRDLPRGTPRTTKLVL